MTARETALADTLAVARALSRCSEHRDLGTVADIAFIGDMDRRIVARRLRSGSMLGKAIAGQGHAVLFKFDNLARRWSLTAAGRKLVEEAK